MCWKSQILRWFNRSSEVIVIPLWCAGGEPTNSDIKLHIQRLTLTLNKAEYELAHAEISGVTADMRMRDNNLSVLGHLGSLALLDTSPHGKLFRERFITTGSQALDFDIFKWVGMMTCGLPWFHTCDAGGQLVGEWLSGFSSRMYNQPRRIYSTVV